jgi:hypothetical protein
MSENREFAKLFNHPETGDQMLMIMDRDEEGDPSLKFMYRPEGFGVVSITLGFDDDDDGWDECQSGFDEVDEDKMVEIYQRSVMPMIEQAGGTQDES